MRAESLPCNAPWPSTKEYAHISNSTNNSSKFSNRGNSEPYILCNVQVLFTFSAHSISAITRVGETNLPMLACRDVSLRSNSAGQKDQKHKNQYLIQEYFDAMAESACPYFFLFRGEGANC